MNLLADSVANRGFTLIELLMVLGIFFLLASLTLPIYSQLQGLSQLREETAVLNQMLQLVRSQSVARLNNSAHGVNFNANPSGQDQYILYQGESFLLRDLNYDRIIDLSPTISLTVNLPTPDLNFSRGSGLPSSDGNIILTHELLNTGQVSINRFGLVTEN